MIGFEVYLVGLGSVMLVLGYLTAKIKNIEALNCALIKHINPPKFKEYDEVMFNNGKMVKCVVREVYVNKSTMKYQYEIINVNSFVTYDNVQEYELTAFSTERKEDDATDEDDVS